MGGTRASEGDAAVSETIAVVLMLGMSVAMAGALYVWLFGMGGPGGGEPSPIALTSNGALSTVTGNKGFTVAATTGDHLWNDLVIKVDGTTFTYDSTLTSPTAFCVSTGSGACVDTSTWNAAATPVAAGHVLTLHGTDLAGKKLQVIHPTSGVMLLSIGI